MKYLRFVLIAFAVLITFVVGIAAFAAWQYRHGMAIDAHNGINESGYVRIGGIDQWVQIRSRDRSNPVLLWLNGEPGCSTIPLTYFSREWEKHFTVVMWDQRGEGKTFDSSGPSVAPTMTIKHMAQDGIELASHLRTRLHTDKIVLLGHSWGSVLGVHMARQRPDLFHVFVGTGQVNQMRASVASAYPRVLTRAREQRNIDAVQELEAVGAPPYADAGKYFVPIKWANELDPMALPLSPGALWALLGNTPCFRTPGWEFSQKLLAATILDENLSAVAPSLDLPVMVIAGAEDLVTPDGKTFLDGVTAPHKAYFSIPGQGHLALASQAFLDLLISEVRPLAQTR